MDKTSAPSIGIFASALQDPVKWQQLLDHLPCSLVVFDAEDRLLLCNAGFRDLYSALADLLVPGRRFEEILRAAIARGLIPQAAGHEQAWIEERLRAHADPQGPLLRQMADDRWLRIIETRLPGGEWLSFGVDVTLQVEATESQQQALAAAKLAAERLEDAVEALPAGFELWDADDRLVASNSELRRLYPRVADALVPGVSWEALVRANHASGELVLPVDDLDAYIATRRVQRRAAMETATHATGEGRWIRTVERPTRDGGRVGVRIDITELRRQRAVAEQAQAVAEAATQRLSDAIEALPDGFALYDADDRLVVCNSRYLELYGESAPSMKPGARFEDVLRYGLANGQYPQATGVQEEWLAARLSRHLNPGPPEIQQLPGNRWLRIDERRTRDHGIAGVRTDITELMRREQELIDLNNRLDAANTKLEQLSETDALTGIANRRLFDRRLAEEWSRFTRHGTPLALLLLDIDHFKRYNDHYGHVAGDACLQHVARRLADCMQRPTDLVARFGGEEFAVLMPYGSADGAIALAERCQAALDGACIEHLDSPVARCVTMSIGVALSQGDDVAPSHTLVRAADRALYQAKAQGRHRIVLAA